MYLVNKNKIYRKSGNLVSSCQYHLVWCPKYRRKVLSSEISQRFKEIILESQADFSFRVIDMEIMPDHVHLLVDCDGKTPIYGIVSKIKARTSKLLREEFPELKKRLPSLWSDAKFISSVGEVNLSTINQYIEEQPTR